MGFLRLIDFLACRLVLALVYPLCASIRAIETGSKYHMRKLVTYWTIFSFISLFEHLFEKLIEWVPLWPYIKLITICWLVIPQFNGACYLYQNLIRPCFPVKLHDSISQFNSSCYAYKRLLYLCLSLKLQTVTDWFNKPMEDPSLKNETFLAVAERYLEDNGSDALEKLIANKSKDDNSNRHAEDIKPTDTSDEAGTPTPNQILYEEGGPVWEDFKVMEHMAKHEAAGPKQVKNVKENDVQIEKKTTAVQIKETSVPADAGEIKLPETNSVKNVQTEWTCAVCQVTTNSEHDLKSHLLGWRHKAKCEGLKTCKQTAKSEERSNDTTKSNQLNQEQVKHAATAQSEHSANKAAEPKQVKNVKENDVQIEKKTTAVQIKETAVPADAGEIKLPETNSVKNVQTEWTCAVCQATTNSEHDLKSHLLGWRHKAKCEGLKTCKQTAKSEERSSDTTKSNQLNQEQVKHAATERSEHSANKAAEPKQVTSVKESNIQIEKKTTAVQIKETAVPADAGEIKLPETNSVKNVQTEWTCAVCQATTNSEHDLKSHLLGWRHKAKCEGLKTCKQTAKSEERSSDTTKSNQLNQEQVKHAATERSEHSANKAAEPKQENDVQIEKKTTAVQIKETSVPADAGEIKLPETNSVKNVQTEWTCAVCQVTTSSEYVLKSHLLGRRHKAKCEGLKTCKQTAKSEERSNDTTKSNQLNQEQVKHAATTRLEHSANKVAEPKQVTSVKESNIQIEKKTTNCGRLKKQMFQQMPEIKLPETNSQKERSTEWTCAVTSVKESNVQIEKKTTAVQIKETAVPADAGEIKLPETNSVKNVQTEWTCAVCQVTTNSEHDLKSHLLGRRHKAMCEGLKTCKQTAKSEERSSDTTKSNQLNQEQVKHAATERSEHSANKAAEPKQVIIF
ncbi:hypothetical protein K7X08_021394 [Anisodus acutangulus]|uniref:HVA22-like protein n=1 Tax=Anisodus acutangulus TaxID=402998 RepID=A0A9Q1M0H8_9SOLA|nr:hypothetical protein K7X08_021394 [Anisodus acutangulus]